MIPVEVVKAINKLACGNCPGLYRDSTDMLKTLKVIIPSHLAALFKRLPNSSITLLFNKGDPPGVKSYRSISLLSVVYKLFTSIIGDRMLKILEENQPPEQAGFRRGYSTLDHILVVKDLIQRSEEYDEPLCMVFVDFEKAFDTVVHAVVWSLFLRFFFA